MLSEAGMLECKVTDTPMDPSLKLLLDWGALGRSRYRILVEKLNYLTMTRPDIAYPISVVSQFMSAPRTNHWDVVIRLLGYLKSTLGRGFVHLDCRHNRTSGFSEANCAGCPINKRSTSLCLWERILCRERVRNMSLYQVRSQNIGLCLILHVSFC